MNVSSEEMLVGTMNGRVVRVKWNDGFGDVIKSIPIVSLKHANQSNQQNQSNSNSQPSSHSSSPNPEGGIVSSFKLNVNTEIGLSCVGSIMSDGSCALLDLINNTISYFPIPNATSISLNPRNSIAAVGSKS